MKIFCSIFAAAAIIVAHHVVKEDDELKPLSPETADLCELGNFHKDCKHHVNVH